MFEKIMAKFGYERKSSSASQALPLIDLREIYEAGLSPMTAFWLWAKSDSVGKAIDIIAKAISQIRPVLKDKKSNEYIKDHPALSLLDSPGFMTSSARLKRELATSLLLSSECYPVLTGNVNYEPSGIYHNYSCNATPVDDASGIVGSIIFTSLHDSGIYTRKEEYKRGLFVYRRSDGLAETHMIKSVTRSYGNRGQSPLERIYYQAMTKYYGNIHNSGLLKNASRPGGLWSPANGSLSQDQYEKFKEEVTNFQGAYSAGKDVVAPQPIKYENFLLNPRDMDFVQLIEASAIDIYNQYDIPLPLVISKTMTMNNYTKAVEAFYDFSVLPVASYLFNDIGRFMLPRYKDGDRFKMAIDEKDLSALKDRMITRGKDMSGTYVFSDNEIRSETGFESYDGGDVIYKPATLTPAGTDDYTGDNIKK